MAIFIMGFGSWFVLFSLVRLLASISFTMTRHEYNNNITRLLELHRLDTNFATTPSDPVGAHSQVSRRVKARDFEHTRASTKIRVRNFVAINPKNQILHACVQHLAPISVHASLQPLANAATQPLCRDYLTRLRSKSPHSHPTCSSTFTILSSKASFTSHVDPRSDIHRLIRSICGFTF